jgi:hypothetical protein
VQVLVDDSQEIVEGERLGEVPGSVDLGGTASGILGSGEHDDAGAWFWGGPVDAGQFPAVHNRHPHVQQDQVWPDGGKAIERRPPMFGSHHVIALVREDERDNGTDGLVIVYDEDGGLRWYEI